MRVLGLIPARGGSKGVPRKNIRMLGGKPLLQYTAETARAARLLSRVVLSTDDEEIAAVARRHGLILFSDEVYRGTEHDPARLVRQRHRCRIAGGPPDWWPGRAPPD